MCFQMWLTFDPPLHFRLVNPSKESLEAGLSRELSEELGVPVPIAEEDHVGSCHAPAAPPSSSKLITHFYVKKMEEEQILEVERAAASTAKDHGQEVTCVCAHVPFPRSHALLLIARPLSRFWGWSECHSTP